MLFVIRTLELRNAERTAIDRAELVTRVLLQPTLRPADLASPVTGERRAALDRLVRTQAPYDSIERLTVANAQGEITYSSDHRLIGRSLSRPDVVAEALGGKALGIVVERQTAGLAKQQGKVLSAFVPVVVDQQTRAGGVVVLDTDYETVTGSADEVFFPVAGVFELTLVGLFLLLVPMLASASGRLRRYAGELEYRANHDELTGLASRSQFATETSLAIERRGDSLVAVLLIDLDRFKEINDALGHATGDVLLQEMADRLDGRVGTGTLARLGGDEFAVVAPVRSRGEAIALAAALQEAVAEPLVLGGVSAQLGSSVGIALAPDHGVDAAVLLRDADHAMYQAKRTGAGTVIYDPIEDANNADRLTLLADLRIAIDEDALDVWFQPIADLATAEVQSMEALVRWNHPTRGLLSAGAFVPLAEHTGLITSLNRHVLGRALIQQAAWLADGIDLDVSVNLTMVDLLDPTLPDLVANALDLAGVEARGLVVEITESAAMADSVRVRETLEGLRHLGVRLAIDDFGTGHSSLAYLQHLPVQSIKIDRSFVARMTDDQASAVIVRSTIELGRSLGLSVVAEGIETAAQWDALIEMGCRLGQGYAISRPLPATDLTPPEAGQGMRETDARPLVPAVAV